jgi:toxin FitB
MTYLLDTNVLSELVKPDPDPAVQRWLTCHQGDSALSSIVLAELADGVEALAEGKKKQSLTRRLSFLIEDFEDQTLVFDEACAWEWARYCNEARSAGHQPPVLDSMLGATARAWGLIMVTRNVSDFPLLAVVNPFEA